MIWFSACHDLNFWNIRNKINYNLLRYSSRKEISFLTRCCWSRHLITVARLWCKLVSTNLKENPTRFGILYEYELCWCLCGQRCHSSALQGRDLYVLKWPGRWSQHYWCKEDGNCCRLQVWITSEAYTYRKWYLKPNVMNLELQQVIFNNQSETQELETLGPAGSS